MSLPGRLPFLRRRLFVGGLLLSSLASMTLPGTLAEAQTCNTTITGKVYSPNGLDVLPNILVYVPTAPVTPFPPGVTDCTTQSALVTGAPLISTTTAADGTFSLTSPALAGTQSLVIQAGKWRRQYPNVVVATACGTTTVPTQLAMPQNKVQGDIPAIAISTGGADALECVFRKIGISDSEFTAPGGGGRINLYAGSAVSTLSTDASGTPLPSETVLMSSPATLNAYDIAMFACQGTANNPAAASATNQANLVNFANVGGRVFATHYGYVWLDNNGPFATTANWLGGTANRVPTANGNGIATIDQTYPEGKVLATWLQNIGATTTQGQLPLQSVKQDQTGVVAPTQSWATLNQPYTSYGGTGGPIMQFTFDTPVGGQGTPTIIATFANTPSQFLRTSAGNTIAVTVTNTSTATSADNTLNLTLAVPAGLTVTGLAGSAVGSGWLCSPTTLTCNRTLPLLPGASDPVVMTLNVNASSALGYEIVSATLNGGGISGTSQCGRVLFNEYHVETTFYNKSQFPLECNTTAMTPQEKFLEFSLYNLSNFIQPSVNDQIDIVATPTVVWATPAPIGYGTPLSATQLNATATLNGVTVPGTFAYTPAAGTVLGLGSNTLNVVFTPTDPTLYTTASGTVQQQVVAATTTTTPTSTPNPSVVGQTVTFTATVSGNGGSPVGTVTFYDGGVAIGTATLTAAGGNSATAILTTSTLTMGNHNITVSYAGATSGGQPTYYGSTSGVLVQVVLGTSNTVINGLVSPIQYGQIIGNTAVVVVTGSSTGGHTTVYIDNVAVCTLPVMPGATQACPANTGAGYQVGTHTTYAVFSGDAQYAGSTSPTYTVQIVPDTTTTTVVSSLNPSPLGQTVTFTVTVSAPYAQPAGPVQLYDGATLLATLTASSGSTSGLSAIYSYSTTALAVGSHPIVASYGATTDFAASTSATLVQVVQPPPPNGGRPGFLMSVTPVNMDILVGVAPAGGIGTAQIVITEVNGFSAPVALTCTGAVAESACVVTQSTMPAGGGTTVLTITAEPPHGCSASAANEGFHPGGRGTMPFLAGLGLVTLWAGRRRRWLQGVALAGLLCLIPMMNGCSTGCTDLGVQPGTYSFTVTGTSPTAMPATQTQTVTLNLKY